MISHAMVIRAETELKHDSAFFEPYRDFRNGVETLPSLLRRRYDVDRNKRGLFKIGRMIGSAVAAINVKKFINFRTGRGKYAQNALLCGAIA